MMTKSKRYFQQSNRKTRWNPSIRTHRDEVRASRVNEKGAKGKRGENLVNDQKIVGYEWREIEKVEEVTSDSVRGRRWSRRLAGRRRRHTRRRTTPQPELVRPDETMLHTKITYTLRLSFQGASFFFFFFFFSFFLFLNIISIFLI